MFRKFIVYLLVTILVVGLVPGISALELPTEGNAPDVTQASAGPTSVEVCGQSDEALTVSAGTDFEASKDETVRFVADLDPDDADVVSYEWRDGSGNQGRGQGSSGRVLSTERSFATTLKAGEHTITLTVETADGQTLTDTVTVLVRGKGTGAETDNPPIADTGDCRMVIADEDTLLNGTESYDRDGTIERYEWDLDGDGTTDVTGETPTVRFEKLGNRTVELTVIDDGGNTDNETVHLFVNDRPRAAFEHAPTRPNPEEEVTFDAASASDILGGIDSYRWDFDGDGAVDATGETATHAFETPGNHTVTLVVTDAYGVSNETSVSVHVNSPPAADASDSEQRANVSEPFELDGTASTDPENGIERYEWDVDGDGEFEKTGATVDHRYVSPGDRNVTLRVTDDGGLTDTDTVTVEVNALPTAKINSSNETVTVGESVAFDGSESDDPDGEIVSYEWNLDGDGTTDATGPTVEHSYGTAGTYTVGLTVTDDDGATDTATRTITVLPDQIDEEPPGLPGPPDDPKGGSGTGDPHLTTFDGRNYDFQAAGEYVLARESTGSLSVQARLDPVSHRPVSVIEAVATSLDGHNVTIDAADGTPLVVDGDRHSLEPTERLDVGDGAVFRRGSKYVVVYPGENDEVDDGDERLTVRVRGNRLDVWLTLQSDRERAVEGLLGTPAEDAPDVALANGTAISPSDYEELYGPFRDDWRVDSDAESHFHYESGESPDSFYDPGYPNELLTVDDLPDDERSAAEQAALEAGLEPGTAAFENAVLDYATTDDDSYLASAATSRPANATFAVDAGSSFEAGVGDPVTFVGSIRNGSSTDVSLEWRFGDGETATGTEVTHAYDATGTHTVTVTATGPDGGVARDTLTVTVAENVTTSQPPIPGVEVAELNETHARLNASTSTDPDGTIAGYVWDTDGDDKVDAKGSTVTVPLESDPAEVSLVVMDDDGNRASETVQLPGLNHAPTDSMLTFESFEDNSYTDDWTYIQNGDGFTAEVSTSRAQQGSHSLYVYSDDFGSLNKSVPVTSHSGPYTFWLYQAYRPGDDFIVSWFDGSTRVFGVDIRRETTGNIHVFSSGSVNTGKQFPTDVWTRVTFTDVNWTDGSFRYEVVTESGTVVTKGRTSFDPSAVDHVDNIRIDSANQWRGHGEYYIDNFTVGRNLQPTANASANPSTVVVGESILFDASNSSDRDGDGLTYEWDFDGDGTTDATGVTPSWTYSSADTYTVTLEVTDEEGATDTDTRNITVEDGATMTVSNPTSYDLSNYQVQVTIDHQSEMQSDFDDVRFYQNGDELPYWIANKTDGSQATVWVRVDSIPANGNVTIDFDYGNASAISHSDPRATMEVYDFHGGNGFSGESLGGSARVMNDGEFLELTDAVDSQISYAAYGTTPAPGFYAEYEYYVGDGTDADSLGIHAWNDGTRRYHEDPDGHGVTWMMNDHDDCVGVAWTSQCGDIDGFSANPVTGSWENVTSWGVRDGDTLTYFHSTLGTTVQGSWSNSNFPPGSKFGLNGRTGGLNNHHWVKNVTIRKYAGQSMNTTVQYK